MIQAGDTRYTYDAENHRIGVETDQTITRYVVDSQQELTRILQAVETDKTTGEKQTTYYTYGKGLLAQEDEKNEYRLYHFNHLGSTTLITDETGQVVKTFEYNPYGELLDGEIGEYRFLFNGEYGVVTDGNGLYYMRARYYNVDIKRFMNQDVMVGSVESSPSLNRYAYVEGNPVNYLDPFGLEKWEGEFEWWHTILSNISYVNAFATVVVIVQPELVLLKAVTDVIGGAATGADIILHLIEMFHYPVGSKYWNYHVLSIEMDIIMYIPILGPVATIGYFIANEINKEQSGKEILETISEDLANWIKKYQME